MRRRESRSEPIFPDTCRGPLPAGPPRGPIARADRRGRGVRDAQFRSGGGRPRAHRETGSTEQPAKGARARPSVSPSAALSASSGSERHLTIRHSAGSAHLVPAAARGGHNARALTREPFPARVISENQAQVRTRRVDAAPQSGSIGPLLRRGNRIFQQ